jgi:hypothetical protein
VLTQYLKDKDCLKKKPWGPYNKKANHTFKWDSNPSGNAPNQLNSNKDEKKGEFEKLPMQVKRSKTMENKILEKAKPKGWN